MLDRKYFKSDEAHARQVLLAPEAQRVLKYAVEVACPRAGVDHPIITATVSTVNEDKACGRKHDQHRRRVAFDIRVKDWAGEQIDAVETDLDKEFNDIAYVNGSGKKEIAFCHGEGDNIHFHVAVNAKFKLPEYTGKNEAS